jgi:hypothetical protein
MQNLTRQLAIAGDYTSSVGYILLETKQDLAAAPAPIKHCIESGAT